MRQKFDEVICARALRARPGASWFQPAPSSSETVDRRLAVSIQGLIAESQAFGLGWRHFVRPTRQICSRCDRTRLAGEEGGT
jgi:hypothetical protein